MYITKSILPTVGSSKITIIDAQTLYNMYYPELTILNIKR